MGLTRFGVLGLTLLGCAERGDAPPSGASFDSGTTGSGTGATGADRTDTGTAPKPGPAGLPDGLIAYFAVDACPAGWSEWYDARGRGLVAVQHPEEVGVQVGQALDGEVPHPHEHEIEIVFDLPGSGVAGATSCCNDDPGRAGRTTASRILAGADPGLPTVALRLCRHEAAATASSRTRERPRASSLTLPAGTAAFFDAPACPAGTRLVPGAAGRFVVGLHEGGQPGTTVGEPLASGEVRTHVHAGTYAVDIPELSVILAPGGNDDHVARGVHTTTATSGPGNLGIPYVQALLCEVEAEPAEPQAGDEVMPPGSIVHTTRSACPDGWSGEWAVEGRLVVGATLEGTVGATHGLPLADGEDRLHTHTQASSLVVPSQELAGANGCCFDEMGRNGTYAVAGDPEPASTGLPTFGLLACRRL